MINNKVYFLAIILLSLVISCSSCKQGETASAKNGEVIFDDGYKAATGGEVIFDDKSLEGNEGAIVTSGKSSREITQIAKDGSQINVSYDGFGNKSETRTFDNNPLLKLVLLRTGVDGSKQVFVYGRSGEVKNLPENMFDRILTASANELASSAGISEVYREQPSYVQNTQQPNITTLPPLPSSQFPVRNQPVEPAPPVETESPTETAEKTAPADNSQLPEKREKVALTKKPDDQ